MVQQPLMSGGIDAGSPITFPEEYEDSRVIPDTSAGGGIWGFFKVLMTEDCRTMNVVLSEWYTEDSNE